MRIERALVAMAAIAMAAGALTPAAQAQGHTYPGYYGLTPSAAYYDLGNSYDRDTYMNPNPFPSYHPSRARPYEEPGYAGYRAYPGAAYPAAPYPLPAMPPYNFHSYDPATPTLGYYYGPGPFVYGHYGRMGRMTFRYGWW